MRWFNGGIAEAVTFSRQNNAVFVVYIQGSNEQSTRFTSFIELPQVSEALSTSSFVAINIEENSVPHQQFSEIYKQTAVPSLYFIGKNGSPLEIITEVQENSVEFLGKITTILSRNGTQLPKCLVNSALQKVEASQASSSSSSANVVEEKGQKEPKQKSHDEKVALAKELIEKKRIETDKEEEEKERVKELERRRLGQEMQDMQRWQQDQQIKQLREERARGHAEELAARKRILDQIAQDKLDRSNRRTMETNTATATAAATIVQQPVRQPQQQGGGGAAIDTTVAKLQFKMADGSSHMREFPVTATLETVRDYVRSNLSPPPTTFTLSTSFPRRELCHSNTPSPPPPSSNSNSSDSSEVTTSLLHSTLVELQLVPNAVVLVVPSGGAGGGGGGGGTVGGATGALAKSYGTWLWGWLVWGPLVALWGWLRGVAVTVGVVGGGEGGTTSAGVGGNRAGSSTTPDGATSNAAHAATLRRRKPATKSTTTTGNTGTGGNVHSLRGTNTDSEDDNNTWNGNSTQQM